MTNPPGKSLVKSVGESDEDAQVRAQLEVEKARYSALAQRKADIEKATRKQLADDHQGDGNPLRTGDGKQEVEEMTARRGLVIVNRDPHYGLGHPDRYKRYQQIEGGVSERQIPMRGSADGAVITEDYNPSAPVQIAASQFTDGGPGTFLIIAIDAPTLGRLIRAKVGTLTAVTAGIKMALGISQRGMSNDAPGFAAWTTTYEPWVYATNQSFTPDVNVGGAAGIALDRVFNSPVPYNNEDDKVFATGFLKAAPFPNRQLYLVIAFNCLKAALPQTTFLEVTCWEQEVV